ncbi:MULTISPECIES: LuxR C-terminal-related transcriptional regulator [unclassified Streptomyces]|uniref:LuxR C-terminal-related transcriptional regulator n=1 Tax=unclassified Streptomyces TaxID=2593676 RepID=UPI001314A81E|nr:MULTISPECIES: LuxR C-terminal-related transcriptional regulator [unclassified Streptomyces]
MPSVSSPPPAHRSFRPVSPPHADTPADRDAAQGAGTALATAGRLRIELRLRSEVLAHGLSAVLNDLPGVADCTVVLLPQSADRPPSGDCDVVVLLAGDPPPGPLSSEGGHRPRVLAIIDGASPETLGSFKADGYLLQQDLSRRTLSRTLEQLAGGEVPLPAPLTRQLARDMVTVPRPRAQTLSVRLTSRERETLVLLSEGCSNKQIATRLGISVHGAKRLVGNVLLKCAAENRTTAVMNAIRGGVLEPYPDDPS